MKPTLISTYKTIKKITKTQSLFVLIQQQILIHVQHPTMQKTSHTRTHYSFRANFQRSLSESDKSIRASRVRTHASHPLKTPKLCTVCVCAFTSNVSISNTYIQGVKNVQNEISTIMFLIEKKKILLTTTIL